MVSRPARPLWWAPALALAGLVFWLSSAPLGAPSWLDLPGGDKLAHAATFGALAVFVYLASGNPWLAVVATSLYGVSDEIHQGFVAGRQADVRDWLADTAGALAAVAAVGFLTRPRTPGVDPVQ